MALDFVGIPPDRVAETLFPGPEEVEARGRAVAVLEAHGGYPSDAREIGRLLDPHSQTIRGHRPLILGECPELSDPF